EESGVGGQSELLVISGRSEPARRELAERYACELGKEPAPELKDVAYSGRRYRVQQSHRLAVGGSDAHEESGSLKRYLVEGKAKGVYEGSGVREPEVVFAFTGQGSQYVGMGSELYQEHSLVREVMEGCDRLLKGELKEGLLAVMLGRVGGAQELLQETRY